MTISFNLLLGTAIGGDERHPAYRTATRQTVVAADEVPGQRPGAFGDALSSTPMLIAAALFVIYLVLGILYESLDPPRHHHLDAALGGGGRIDAADGGRLDFSVIAMIGVILLIGIVKKNGIMLIDVALHIGQQEGSTAEEAIYVRACCASARS